MIKKKAKQIANQAKQIAREESEEFLKTGRRQIGVEALPKKPAEEKNNADLVQEKEKDTQKSQRLNQALEAELQDIRRRREEQKEVWQTEQEEKMAGEKDEEKKPLVEPKTKPQRGNFKARLEARKKRIETRKPSVAWFSR